MRTRGFEIVNGYENESITIPMRQTLYSAGYDIEACETVEIAPNEVKLVKTGLKAYMLEDELLKLYIRSSMAINKGVMLANNVGIIDSDYYNNEKNNGHIIIPLYNFSNQLLIIYKGEKIAQGIFEKYLVVDKDTPNHQIRKGGFGSSNH
ncbi:dUTP diphosphatase [Mycoplasmatota bacterium]|nr:dUTP diphosphatase [Mycoplasmatota bacterium]